MQEKQWERERRLGKEPPNPFARKRQSNQRTRYLDKRESTVHPSLYDLGGNQTAKEN
jgi:hypothetical protein